MKLRVSFRSLVTMARINLVLFIFWLIPGAAISWVLRDSVPWVNFMSWYAIVVSQATAWFAARTQEVVVEPSEGGE